MHRQRSSILCASVCSRHLFLQDIHVPKSRRSSPYWAMLRRFSHLIKTQVIGQSSEALVLLSGEVDGTVTVWRMCSCTCEHLLPANHVS